MITDNLCISCDNIVGLNHLINQETKVDLIYIDPPYNINLKGRYNDNKGTHEQWVSFMRDRLLLARDLLSDQGSIFMSIDDKEYAYLKILWDEIFWSSNFLSNIIWQDKYTVSNDKKWITTQTEYILAYAKNIKNVRINNDPLREEYVSDMYKNVDNDPRWPWRLGVQLFKKKNPNSYTVKSPSGKEWTMPWNYSEKEWYDNLVKNDLIYWWKDGNSCPVKKVFLHNSKGRGIRNLWLGSDVWYSQDGGDMLEKILWSRLSFMYPKPVSLIKRIIEITTWPESLILDFFAGSWTTWQAVLELNSWSLNRKFILMNNNEEGIFNDVLRPRIEKVVSWYSYERKWKISEVPWTGGTVSFTSL